MKIILTAIGSKYIHTALGLRSIRAYAKAHGIETEARPVRLGAETTFLCPTDFTDLHRFSVSASG